MRTYIKAYMSLNFGQIPPLTTELAALERLKNRCHHVIAVDIDPTFFKLAGNKDMHNIMNEFKFRPDRTTDYRVSCPWASKKYPHRLIMGKMVFPLFLFFFFFFFFFFLIGSFWYFHVTRTSIKAWMSSNFLKWDLTLAHWTQVSDRCPLGDLFLSFILFYFFFNYCHSRLLQVFIFRNNILIYLSRMETCLWWWSCYNNSLAQIPMSHRIHSFLVNDVSAESTTAVANLIGCVSISCASRHGFLFRAVATCRSL